MSQSILKTKTPTSTEGRSGTVVRVVGVNIGYCEGAGSLTITGEGVKVSTPNNLYIGGVGHWKTTPDWYKEEAHDGTVTVTDKATLTIGVSSNKDPEGAKLQIGTSEIPSKGTLIVDGGTVESNVMTFIGGDQSEGTLEITNGGEFSVDKRGNISASESTFVVGNNANSTGHVLVDGGKLLFTSDIPHTTNIGLSGTADVTICNGGSMEQTTGSLMLGAYSGSNGTLTVTGDESELSVICSTCVGFDGKGSLIVSDGAYASLDIVSVGHNGEGAFTVTEGAFVETDKIRLGHSAEGKGELTVTDGSSLYGGTLEVGFNGTGNLFVGEGSDANFEEISVAAQAGSSGAIVNKGDILVEKSIRLNSNSSLTTGTVAVSNRENEYDDGSGKEVGLNYSTGLDSMENPDAVVVLEDGAENVYVGATVVGDEETMQYLTKDDLSAIANKVLAGLGLEPEANVSVSNRIGEYITAQYTTDDVNNETSSEIVSLSGGTAVIKVGNENAGSTIGSYYAAPTETKAHIRMDERATGTHVVWEGENLNTVEGETCVITKDSSVELKAADSALVVVADSTLKGEGTFVGTVEVMPDGHLFVGNSAPGTMTVGSLILGGALDIAVTSFDGTAGTAFSQLVLGDGGLSFNNGATINILIGGDAAKEPGEFDLAIITGIGDGFTLTENAVSTLVANTTFTLAADAFGLPSVGDASADIPVEGLTYELQSDGNGTYALHVKGKTVTVPEPATATLSLLALAALAARRRRKV